jgi:3-carboxy-cis,cis-muconate cycloisomerase
MTAADGLHASLFGESGVAECLSDRARLQAILDVEVALAEAEAQVGVIPAAAVAPIRQAARADLYDRSVLVREAPRAGNIAIPLIEQLTRLVASIDLEASRYVHWGATSQDVLDTSLVLQLRAAAPRLDEHLDRAAAAAAEHARGYRLTPIAGRTWLQQATPTTFGLKAAGWLDALERARRHADDAFSEARVLQFGGASGTLAALGANALAVSRALANRLELELPPAPWHAHRDRFAHLACTLGVITGTLGKIARDVALLSQTEVREAYAGEAGGSSTMPHKRNPVAAGVAIAATVRVPGLVSSMLSAMPQEHERGLGGWQAEWDVVPQILLLTAGAARAVADALNALVVDAARMRNNLDITHGMTQAEAIVIALGPHLGKRQAHALVEAACARAAAEARALADVLAEDAVVTGVMTRQAIEQCLAPDAYLGAADEFVERILSTWKRT